MTDAQQSPPGIQSDEAAKIKAQVQVQFGAHADGYVTSEVHALGWSRERLAELIPAQPEWRALDVATGGGHTALLFAPKVKYMVALDLTFRMLQAARHFTKKRQESPSIY